MCLFTSFKNQILTFDSIYLFLFCFGNFYSGVHYFLSLASFHSLCFVPLRYETNLLIWGLLFFFFFLRYLSMFPKLILTPEVQVITSSQPVRQHGPKAWAT